MYKLSAFKTYDIRGVWQNEIDEEFSSIMWYSLGLYLREKHKVPKILISSDVREANMIMIDEFLRGIRAAGIEEVTVIGENPAIKEYRYGICSTPLAYYATIDTYDCACIFTASHNPSEYVGIKIVDTKCLSIKSSELRSLFEKHCNSTVPPLWELPIIQTYTDSKINDLLEDIEKKILSLKKIPKITIDYSHGAATHFEQTFLKKVLGENAVHICITPDGSFPAHDTDTSRFANYEPLLKTIQENGSDFGFIFDGDADRFGMVIPDGTVVTGDILLAIIAKQLLSDGTAEKLGSTTIFQEVFCGKIVRDTVEKYGGKLRMTRVWRESFVREVIEANGLLAGEVSTHLLFKEYGTIEMPLAGLYYIFLALENYTDATTMIREYNTYARGQVIQFITDKKDEAIEALKVKYSNYNQITIDGIRIEAPEWWFCVRKSGTEPLLKIAIEGKNREIYERILAELRLFFRENGAIEKI